MNTVKLSNDFGFDSFQAPNIETTPTVGFMDVLSANAFAKVLNMCANKVSFQTHFLPIMFPLTWPSIVQSFVRNFCCSHYSLATKHINDLMNNLFAQ